MRTLCFLKVMLVIILQIVLFPITFAQGVYTSILSLTKHLSGQEVVDMIFNDWVIMKIIKKLHVLN